MTARALSPSAESARRRALIQRAILYLFIYALTLMWLVPDRRIERSLQTDGA